MEALRSSETSVNKISTRRHIPEDGILQSQSRENLKSYIYYNNPVFYGILEKTAWNNEIICLLELYYKF
jgi:hypothetical protein